MNKEKSFSLIELLVAITIFMLVISSAVGLFVSSIRSQSKLLTSQKILDETGYAIEYMSRALRMAKKETKTDPAELCLSSTGSNYNNPTGQSSIRFINYNDQCQEFFLDGDQLKEKRAVSSNDASHKFSDLPTSGVALTSAGFTVSKAIFLIQGDTHTPSDDGIQPRVTIVLEIGKGSANKIQIQTTISQRDLDVVE